MRHHTLLTLVIVTAACGESPAEPPALAPTEAGLIYLDFEQVTLVAPRSLWAVEGALSQGCGQLNVPGLDAFYRRTTTTPLEFVGGETMTVSAGPPTLLGNAQSIGLDIFDESLQLLESSTTSFPGTVTYTFPALGTYTVGWLVFELDNVTWSVSCEAGQRKIGVSVDIKPGSDPNSIEPRSMGTVPVAILGSATFDVTDVDVATLAFGPNGAAPAHDLTHPDVLYEHTHEEVCDELSVCVWEELDANGDGYPDLISHYRQKETGLAPSDTEACMSGLTVRGIPLEGCDAVNVLGS